MGGGEWMNPIWKRRWFWIGHVGVLLCVLLFPLYRYLTDLLPPLLTGCIVHNRLFLYCPVCGGTRAVEALLRLDLLGAFRLNAFVTVCILAVLVIDALAWIRFFQKRSPYFRINPWFWVIMAVSLVGYTVLRNLFMVVWGIDPTGDLGIFWQMIRK